MSGDQTMDATEATARDDHPVLRIRISLKGRPLRTVSFVKDVVTVGRDPEADVFLDNPGISRQHLRLERSGGAYRAQDLGSANGTLLNDRALESAVLGQNDVLHVGKYSLWICYEEDRREPAAAPAQPSTTHQGTTVLTTAELEKMIAKMRDEPAAPMVEPPQEQRLSPPQPPRHDAWRSQSRLVLAAALGAVLGAGLTWWLTN